MNATQYNRWFLWLLGLTAFVLFFRIGATPIYILDEAKNAQCAREMLTSGNWIVPTFNGKLRTDKPALHYWFMIFSYKLWGVNAGAARFFSACLGLATIAITFWFVKKWKDAGTAFCTALVLALSTHFLFEFRLSVPDPYLIFFNTAGLCFGFNYFQEKKWKWLLSAAASLALATLAKGPVALALPGLSIVLYLIISGRWLELFDWKLLLALVVYTAIALPWYWQVHMATAGEWTKGFFLDHNLNRFSGEKEGHGGLFIITPIIVFVGLLPFSMTIFSVFQRKYSERRYALMVFSWVVALVYIVFFSISSTKLPNYPMPCYPFVAVILGRFIYQLIDRRQTLPKYAKIALVVFGIALAIGGYFAIAAEQAVKHLAWLTLPLLVLPLLLAVAFFSPKSQRRLHWLKFMILGYFVFNIYFLCIAYPVLYSQNPVTKMMPIVQNQPSILCAYQAYNPAFNFNKTSGTFILPVFDTKETLQQYCLEKQREGKQILVVSRKDRIGDLDRTLFIKIAEERDLFERPTTVMLRWEP